MLVVDLTRSVPRCEDGGIDFYAMDAELGTDEALSWLAHAHAAGEISVDEYVDVIEWYATEQVANALEGLGQPIF